MASKQPCVPITIAKATAGIGRAIHPSHLATTLADPTALESSIQCAPRFYAGSLEEIQFKGGSAALVGVIRRLSWVVVQFENRPA